MTAESPQGDEPLIPMPALSLPALRQAVATVAPSRLPEFCQEVQDAFTQAGDEDSVFPIRHFYQRWGAAIAIERQPSLAARLHAAERARADPDPAVRDRAVREAAKTVQAAYREVAGGRAALTIRESMIFLDGREFTGEPPGLRTVQRGPLMLVYLTDVRGERVVIIQVNWIS